MDKTIATLTINLEDTDDITGALREIAEQVEKGFTSGYYPIWELS